jgi:hypothetical protein
MYDDDEPDDWHTFIYKASAGSIKAVETLNYANMAYMVDFTGDPDSPNTMHLDDYDALVRDRFPNDCPFPTIQQFHDTAVKHDWISKPIAVSETPYNSPAKYVAIWGCAAVNESALINDSMLNCLTNWSPDHYIECVRDFGLGYDSRNAVAGMFYISSTWPGT